MDTSNKRVSAIEIEIALINRYVQTTNDEELRELLLLRKDVLDHELYMIVDARVEEQENVRDAIDQLLKEI